MASDDDEDDERRRSDPAAYNAYREMHPKIRYSSAREAARALQVIKRNDNISNNHYSNSRSRLHCYYDCDDGCYYLGHTGRG